MDKQTKLVIESEKKKVILNKKNHISQIYEYIHLCLLYSDRQTDGNKLYRIDDQKSEEYSKKETDIYPK